jgi:hypothetical protein
MNESLRGGVQYVWRMSRMTVLAFFDLDRCIGVSCEFYYTTVRSKKTKVTSTWNKSCFPMNCLLASPFEGKQDEHMHRLKYHGYDCLVYILIIVRKKSIRIGPFINVTQ